MEERDLKKEILIWAQEVGPQVARVELAKLGIGFSTIEKLIGGRYESTPRSTLAWSLQKLLDEHKDEAS